MYKNRYMFNVNDILMKLILVSPLAMLVQRVFDAANRVIVGGILVCLVLCLLKGTMNKSKLGIISVGMLVFLFSLTNIDKRYFSINMLFYYPLWIIYLCFAADSYEKMIIAFKNNKSFTRIVIWLWCILVVISSFIPSSYNRGDFRSFTEGNFRFAPTVFFMASLIWVYCGMFKERKYMIFMIVPFISMIATGSRTYAIILLILDALAFYNFFEKKVYFWMLLIPAILLVADVLAESQFILKFYRALENKYAISVLAALTSNRSVFWAGELRLFGEAGIIEKLFGGGLTSSYVKNVSITNQAIWAHNDFLEALNAHGLVGLLIYVSCFLIMYKRFNSRLRYKFIQKTVFLSCLILNAFFNGLYVYTTAMLSIPFLGYAVTIDFAEIKKKA